MTRIEIIKGIHLNIIEEHKFKTNLLKIDLAIPLKSETAPLASLLPAVLRRGTENNPTMLSLNRRLEYLYATVLGGASSKTGENQCITFNASFLRNDFIPDGTDLLSDVLSLVKEFLFRPHLIDGVFCEEYVVSEKKNLCDKIGAEINNKGSYAVKRLFEEMCKDEPYSVSVLGTPESVNAVTPKELYDFYQSVIFNSPVEIFFVGVCDSKALINGLTEIFAPYERKTNAEYQRSIVKTTADSVTRVTEKMPVNQGKLTMGFRTDACTEKGNNAVFNVFNEIFGGSPTSKLFENVREKMSLCYYCSSRYIGAKGIMYVTSGVKVGDEKRAEEEILRQLDLVKQGDFSENDIELAKLSLINSYNSLLDDADRLASFYLSRIVTGAPLCEIREAIAEIQAVSKEEITEIAKTVQLDTVYFLEGTNLENEAEDEE